MYSLLAGSTAFVPVWYKLTSACVALVHRRGTSMYCSLHHQNICFDALPPHFHHPGISYHNKAPWNCYRSMVARNYVISSFDMHSSREFLEPVNSCTMWQQATPDHSTADGVDCHRSCDPDHAFADDMESEATALPAGWLGGTVLAWRLVSLMNAPEFVRC